MRFLPTLLLVLIVCCSFAQEKNNKGWHLKDKTDDGMAGISLNKAYQFLQDKKSTPIIVAVIDSGIDTLHEDLKNVLWTNTKEIPGNGIDDDGNGYVDDVHGWNFLGGKDGTEVEKASAEKPRVYHGFKDKFLNKTIDTHSLSYLELYQYKMWKRAAAEIEPDPEKITEAENWKRIIEKLIYWDSLVVKESKVADFSSSQLEKIAVITDEGKRSKMGLLKLMNALPFGSEAKFSVILNDLKDEMNNLNTETQQKETPPEDVHKTIIKDNYTDFNDRYYGNNNIMGKGSLHGTHVSGIIAAERNNNIGIDGIADNVQIMVVRAVPDGDEYDKDIAEAIRYAVDNGAKVINMSFGKSYSPQKQWVDEAIKYAESKDVLLVHAAGNDGRNNDSAYNFPNPKYLVGGTAKNIITVGASGDTSIIDNYIAGFSNYGKATVDVFAPGSQIYSTLPGGNQYGFEDGTSMATPVVAGLAALVRSYYPTLTAVQTKQIIEQSVSIINSKLFYRPGTEEQVKMSDMCASGGIVNAYKAVIAAEEFTHSRKLKAKQKPQPASVAY